MKAVYIIIIVLAMVPQLKGQTKKNASVNQMPADRSIDKFIPMVKNKRHRGYLQKFVKDRDSLTQMSLARETRAFYEIWVDHSSSDGYTWGEGYTLNKKDGTIEMIWHEHPNKAHVPEINIEFEKKASKPDKSKH